MEPIAAVVVALKFILPAMSFIIVPVILAGTYEFLVGILRFVKRIAEHNSLRRTFRATM